jgi:hypothetical protein
MQQKEQIKWYFTEIRSCCNHCVDRLKGILKNCLFPISALSGNGVELNEKLDFFKVRLRNRFFRKRSMP